MGKVESIRNGVVFLGRILVDGHVRSGNAHARLMSVNKGRWRNGRMGPVIGGFRVGHWLNVQLPNMTGDVWGERRTQRERERESSEVEGRPRPRSSHRRRDAREPVTGWDQARARR